MELETIVAVMFILGLWACVALLFVIAISNE